MPDPLPPLRTPCRGSIGKRGPCYARPGADWCGNHDPARADARRANGAKRRASQAPRTPFGTPSTPSAPKGWREEWRAPRGAREGDEDRVARAREVLEAPTPASAELRDEALRVLRAVALEGVSENARVAASKVLLDACPRAPARDEDAMMSEASLGDLLEQ
jgi:hypothetical protein